jgi:glutamate racemase
VNRDKTYCPIGFFDSGYGGLTVLKEVMQTLPQYDYVYLGDNARAPYGSRSFESVYEYTLECVQKLFNMGCELIILACNTASAKALRTIQQKDLPGISPSKRVLGVIRPTTEVVKNYTKTNHIGLLATQGTVTSQSYPIELHKFAPEIQVFQQACPMWVPLIESGAANTPGADYFLETDIRQLLDQSSQIDTVILGCTHYPLLLSKIKKHLPPHVSIVMQGEIIAKSLQDYLQRHPEIENKCSKNGEVRFYTTDSAEQFSKQAAQFFGKEVKAEHIAV